MAVDNAVLNRKLPSGVECQVLGETVVLEHQVHLTFSDVAELTRFFFTSIPLAASDVRLSLMEEVRAAVIKEDVATHKRWIALNALRTVSWKKLRLNRHKTT